MTINTHKENIIIIKSKKVTYVNLMQVNNILEEVISYKYLIIDFHHKLNSNYNNERMINGQWKDYYGFENSFKTTNIYLWDMKKLPFETLSLLLYYMSVKFGVPTLKEAWRMVK